MKRKRIVSLGILCCFILPSVLSSCNTEMEQGDGTGRDNVLYTSGDLNDNNAVSAGAQTDVPDTDRREFTNGSSDTDAVRFSFVAAGDNVIHESVFVDAKNRAISAASIGTYSGTYYFDEMYLGIKDLFLLPVLHISIRRGLSPGILLAFLDILHLMLPRKSAMP